MKYIPAAILALATTIIGIIGSAQMIWTSVYHGPFFVALSMQIIFAVMAIGAGALVLFLSVCVTKSIVYVRNCPQQTEELDK